jgi:hypothetical protein
MRLSIYIAGPFTNGETLPQRTVKKNVKRAIEVGAKIKRKGHYIFIPHYSYYMDASGYSFEYDDWMREDLYWIKKCDAMFVIEGKSIGVDREIEYAKHLKKRIFHDLNEVPDGEM